MERYSHACQNPRAAGHRPPVWGKRLRVFGYRLERQMALLESVPVSGKFGGATGNFNAHRFAYPDIDWPAFGNRFLKERLGIDREEWTTQISNYDNLAALFDALRRINTIVQSELRPGLLAIHFYGVFQAKDQSGRSGFVGNASQGEPHRL